MASYGSVVPVSGRDPSKFQYQGFGMLLMEEAERIAVEEHGSYKISVISGSYRNIHSPTDENKSITLCYVCLINAGVGTRNYYRKIGYELDGPYMSKLLVD